MMTNIENQKSYAILAQIYNACYYSRSNEKNVEKILEKTANINSKLSENAVLHFAFHTEKIKIFDLLLSHSADYTLPNSKGSTVLLDIIRFSHNDYADSKKIARQLVCPYANSILSAHVKDGNFSNPQDENEISHFHGACMTNHIAAVELFLNNGISVDQAIKMESPYFAGYTALHFAVRCGSLETIRILLQRGANLSLKDAKGMTPLQLLIKLSIKIVDWINTGKDMIHRRLPNDLKVNEEIINAFIKYNYDSNNLDTNQEGLSYFHLVCTIQDTTVFENLLKDVKDINDSVSTDSPICPGYTPTHFAALFNLNTLKLLLQNGAKLDSRDVNGVTPFDLCLEKYDVSDIHSILLTQPTLRSILLSDNKTNLLDVILSMRDPIEFETFLENTKLDINTYVPSDSPLWPKYTLLHLAVTLSEKFKQKFNYSLHPCVPIRLFKPSLEIIKKCLDRGSDITCQDCHGRTPLHLAFRQFKVNTVDTLLQYHQGLTNITDEDGLSHLQVACAAKNVSAVEKLLLDGADVQSPLKTSFKWYSGQQYRTQAGDSTNLIMSSGSTLMHIAVAIESREIVEVLSKYRADPYAIDDNGKTPIHLLIGLRKPKPIADLLLSLPNLKDVVSINGLSHLHVATAVQDISAVERLLDQGVNINFIHNDSLTYYTGYTPLGIAIERNWFDITGLLIKRGADIFSKNPEEKSLVYKIFSYSNRWLMDYFIDRLKNDEIARKFMETDSGITMLYVACHVRDVDALRILLNDGVDVNVRAHEDSELWPGCTPLHVLLMPSSLKLDNKVMMQLLLDNNADVTLVDAEGNTPVHLALRDLDRAFSLLKHQKDFNVNPKSAENISHFHLACLANDTASMEKFLKFGASVNEPVDYFSRHLAGYSPLHLALNNQSTDISPRLKTLDYLLQNGANVNAEDAFGNTPFHIAANCQSNRLDLLKKIYSAGADIKAIDIFGKTPFEALLRSENNCTIEEVEFFLKNGCYLNEFNPVNQMGYIGLIFSRQNQTVLQDKVLEITKNHPYFTKPDDHGRTVIHNIVSTSTFVSDCSESRYIDVIRKLTEFGCDIDNQDKQGKTPLHKTASFGNTNAVCALLKIGANANLTDFNGQTAFSDALDAYNQREDSRKFEHIEVLETFIVYFRFLEICGIPINELSLKTQKIVLKTLECYSEDTEKINRFVEQMEKTKTKKIGKMTLSNFLSEIEAVNGYIDILESDRNTVDEFFRSSDESDYDEVKCILNLHYRKALNKLNSKD